MIQETVHLVGDVMVGYIGDDEDVLAAAGIQNNALAFTVAEADSLHSHAVVVLHIILESGIVLSDRSVFVAEFLRKDTR